MIVASCAESKPDLVLALAQAPLSNKALERLRQCNITTAFWFVEDYQVMKYWQAHAHLYDYYFTIQDGDFFNELRKVGVRNCCYLPLAADIEVHKPERLPDDQLKCYGSDLSFMGAGYYNRERLLQGLIDYDFKVWGTDWNPMSPLWKHVQRNAQRLTTEETVKVFNATKVNINLHSSVCHEGINPFGDFVNPRTFEIAGCSGFQLVDHRSLLPRHFKVGDEIICYESLDELRDKASYYLHHPEERKMIAMHAYQRVLGEHTYEKRMTSLLSTLTGSQPELLFSAKPAVASIVDPDMFCAKHPETKPLIDTLCEQGLSADLQNIVDSILRRNGKMGYHEALFLLMREFQNKFQEYTL